MDGIIVGWHVGTLRDIFASLGNNALSLLAVDLVLGGAWHDDVDVTLEDGPWALAFIVLGGLGVSHVVRAAAAIRILDVHHDLH